MSKISDIYDALLTVVTTALPDHKRLANPYQIEENSELKLKKGYGLAFGAGTNTFRVAACAKVSVSREFVVTLTRGFKAFDTNVTKRASSEKDLFEDQKLLVAAIENDPTLASSSVAKADFTSDGGLEFVFGEKDNFIKLASIVTIEFFEDLP